MSRIGKIADAVIDGFIEEDPGPSRIVMEIKIDQFPPIVLDIDTLTIPAELGQFAPFIVLDVDAVEQDNGWTDEADRIRIVVGDLPEVDPLDAPAIIAVVTGD